MIRSTGLKKEWQKVSGRCHSFYAKFVAIVLQIVVVLAVVIVVANSINHFDQPILSTCRSANTRCFRAAGRAGCSPVG